MTVRRIVFAMVVGIAAVALFSCGGSSARGGSPDGFELVGSVTEEELETINANMVANKMISAIGVGSADDEKAALKVAEHDTRSKLAAAVSLQATGLSEDFDEVAKGAAKGLFESGTKQIVSANISGAPTYKKVKQYNKKLGQYKFYTLMYIDPEIVKNVFAEEINKINDDALHAQKDKMMAKLDAAIEYKKSNFGGK